VDELNTTPEVIRPSIRRHHCVALLTASKVNCPEQSALAGGRDEQQQVHALDPDQQSNRDCVMHHAHNLHSLVRADGEAQLPFLVGLCQLELKVDLVRAVGNPTVWQSQRPARRMLNPTSATLALEPNPNPDITLRIEYHVTLPKGSRSVISSVSVNFYLFLSLFKK
jgi:hypothetical protein